jgi:hypothetical protein
MSVLAGIEALAAPERLTLLGVFHDDGHTLALLGPDEPAGFWAHFKTSPEWRAGGPDPLDRWSERVVGAMADRLGARALFPFGGPPWHPFYSWALRTGRIHQSPVRLLVHDRAGLWVSFRGALRIAGRVALPGPPPSPCDSCAEKPCLTACPAGALGARGYDVPACHGFLDTEPGRICMETGCRVRAACPVSRKFARVAEQSAYHMARFHPTCDDD